MNMRHNFFLFAVTAAMVFPLAIQAQSTGDAIRITDNQTGFGARALGMGGAYSAVADDYSAVYWNPAGLAQMRKMEYWLGVKHDKFNNDINYLGNSSTASNSTTKISSIGFVFPVPTYRGSLVFALGYQRIKGFEYANNFKGISSLGTSRLSFELDTTGTLYDFYGKPVEKQEEVLDGGNINQYSAAGAIDVSPNVSVGVSLNYWTGNSDYSLNFAQYDIFNNFTVFPANFNDYLENNRIMTKYSSFSMKVGGLFHAGRSARFTLGMELPQTFNVKEDYLSESSVAFDDGEIIDLPTENGTFEYNVKIPFRFTGGVSAAFGPVLLAGEAKYTDWTQVKFKQPSNTDLTADISSLLDENIYFKTDYRETVKLSVGGETGLPFYNSQLRAGFIYDPNPLKDAPSNENRKYFTAGYGVLIDRIFKIDFAYMRGWWKETTFDDLAPAGTQEDITYQKLLFTFAYRF